MIPASSQIHRFDCIIRCPSLCRFSDTGNDETLHARWRPASEKRQGTKSRWVERGGCRRRYGDFAAGFALLRLEGCGRRARFSSKDAGARGWKRVDRTLADPIEGGVAVQSRELMRVRSLPAVSQQE